MSPSPTFVPQSCTLPYRSLAAQMIICRIHLVMKKKGFLVKEKQNMGADWLASQSRDCCFDVILSDCPHCELQSSTVVLPMTGWRKARHAVHKKKAEVLFFYVFNVKTPCCPSATLCGLCFLFFFCLLLLLSRIGQMKSTMNCLRAIPPDLGRNASEIIF